MPTSLLIDSEQPKIREATSTRVAEKVLDMHKFMKEVNQKVQENEDRHFAYAKNRHDKDLPKPFEVGDEVYKTKHPLDHKFERNGTAHITWRRS